MINSGTWKGPEGRDAKKKKKVNKDHEKGYGETRAPGDWGQLAVLNSAFRKEGQ